VRLAWLLLLAASTALGWHVPAHQRVTRAAIRSLPQPDQDRWVAISPDIIERYCLLPDVFRGRQVDREEYKVYCLKPDGKAIHNVQWKRDEDIDSIAYSLDGLIRAMQSKDLTAAARHAGVLSHFLGDSTCPSHAYMPKDSPLAAILKLAPPPDHHKDIDLHTEIERTTPEFDLGGRRPTVAGATVRQAAERLVDRTYAAIEANRKVTIDLVKALYIADGDTIDRCRQLGARAGAELIADAYRTALEFAAKPAK
jgi:hypothetical protein